VNGDEEGKDEQGKGDGNPNQARSARGSRGGRYSRAFDRGLQVVACFTAERPELGVREVAGMLEMSPTATHRYLSALASQGYLEQEPASSKYRLSLGAIDLGMAALSATGLCMHARPYIEELARRTGFTVQIGVLDGPEVLLVAALAGKRRDQREPGCDARVGARLPAYCTSLGKVLLAYLPAERRGALVSDMELKRYRPGTVTSEPDLRAVLARVLEDGSASSEEELAAGACAIAAPVRDESGDVIAAVNVVAQHGVVECSELVRWCEGELLATAERISTRLGWQGAGQ